MHAYGSLSVGAPASTKTHVLVHVLPPSLVLARAPPLCFSLRVRALSLRPLTRTHARARAYRTPVPQSIHQGRGVVQHAGIARTTHTQVPNR
jgi:hypothetical protein